MGATGCRVRPVRACFKRQLSFLCVLTAARRLVLSGGQGQGKAGDASARLVYLPLFFFICALRFESLRRCSGQAGFGPVAENEFALWR